MTPRSFSILFWVFLASAAVGALIGLARTQDASYLQNGLFGALTGVIIGFGGTLAELTVFPNSQRRFTRNLPVAAIMVIRAAYYSILIVVALAVPSVLLGEPVPWFDPEFGEVFFVSALIALGFSISIEILRQLGGEATLALFTGRYIRPRLEDRVILFADLVGSTTLAERIGDLQFHAFLQEVALDLADPIERNRGRVHRYVGDAVIVTWRLKPDVASAAYLDCAIGMHVVLKDRAASYRARFGAEPRLRVAVHCGPVAAGEIGDWKKEISLLGDTMNTAARIESAARDLGVETALSDDVKRLLPPARQSDLIPLPNYLAHGKQAPLVLWAPARV